MVQPRRKTITYRDVEKLAKSGLEISLKRGYHLERLYGIYDNYEIRIYLLEHKSKKEISETILHEYVHVLEGKRGFKNRISEKEIEEIVRETLRKKPRTIDFIKELYSLKY